MNYLKLVNLCPGFLIWFAKPKDFRLFGRVQSIESKVERRKHIYVVIGYVTFENKLVFEAIASLYQK